MPVSASAEHEPAPSSCPNEHVAERTSPMTPPQSSRSAAIAGKWRDHTPCRKKRRFSAASASTRSASSAARHRFFAQHGRRRPRGTRASPRRGARSASRCRRCRASRRRAARRTSAAPRRRGRTARRRFPQKRTARAHGQQLRRRTSETGCAQSRRRLFRYRGCPSGSCGPSDMVVASVESAAASNIDDLRRSRTGASGRPRARRPLQAIFNAASQTLHRKQRLAARTRCR